MEHGVASILSLILTALIAVWAFWRVWKRLQEPTQQVQLIKDTLGGYSQPRDPKLPCTLQIIQGMGDNIGFRIQFGGIREVVIAGRSQEALEQYLARREFDITKHPDFRSLTITDGKGRVLVHRTATT